MRNNFTKMPGDWLFKVVPVFIAIGFLMVIGMWIFYGWVAYKVVTTDPQTIGETVGKTVRSIEEGYKNGQGH